MPRDGKDCEMRDAGGKTAAEVAREIADALQRQRLPYAIGGALALGFYAPPRVLRDSGKTLESAWIRRKLMRLVGTDERLRAWDELLLEVVPRRRRGA